MSDVQIAVIDQQDTQIVLAVPGVQGATGSSIPSGGTADQVLRKNSSTNYDANWTQVTSAMIADGTIVNADVNASAAIAGTKISPDFGGQTVTTTGQVNAARVNVTVNTAPTNGIYLPASNTVGISTNGTGRLFVDASGRVTVAGTTGATFKVGDALAPQAIDGAGSSYTPQIYNTQTGSIAGIGVYTNDGTINRRASFFVDQTNALWGLSLNWSSGGLAPFVIRDANAERLRISGTGVFTVGSNATTPAVSLDPGTTTAPLVRDSLGRLLVGTSSASTTGTAVFQGNSGGATSHGIINIGRGSTNPGVNLSLGFTQFQDAAGSVGAQIYAQTDAAWSSGSYPGRLVFSTTAAGASSPTERVRITSDGRAVFGGLTTTVGNTTSNIIVGTAATTSGSVGIEGVTSLTTLRYHVVFSNGNGRVGSISTDGTATAYTTSSDYRLKENITAVTDGITRLQQLKPSRFNFIADPDKTVDGFIAHEVQTIVPEAITGEKDAVDDDGNPQYQGIDQSKLVPLLTAALQEAIAKIETLEARLTAAGL